MQASKKLLMLVGTILGNCLVLVLYHFLPDLPSDVVQWVIGGISGAGLGGVLGQGFADGLSRGLTSSQGGKMYGLETVSAQHTVIIQGITDLRKDVRVLTERVTERK